MSTKVKTAAPPKRPALAGHAGQEARELVEQLKTAGETGFLVPAPKSATGLAVESLGFDEPKRFEPSGDSASEGVERVVLEALKGLEQPTVVVPQIASTVTKAAARFAAILPSGFDASRKTPYPLVLLAPSAKTAGIAQQVSRGELLTKLDKLFEREGLEDAVVVMPEPAPGLEPETYRAMLEKDLKPFAAKHLNASAREWGTFNLPQLSARPGGLREVEGDFEDDFQPGKANSAGQSSAVALPIVPSKTTDVRGTFFAPILGSNAIKKPVRCGVYLPPGYDQSNERYPIMVFLPEQGQSLEAFASTIAPQLDALMSNGGQKMLLVMPEVFGTLWHDYDKNGSSEWGTKGERDYEGLLINEVLGYARDQLKTDGSRMALHGGGRGGFGAMSIGLRHEGTFKSVSAQSGVLALDGDSDLASEHFGEGDPKLGEFNPIDLVAAGKLNGPNRPRIYLEASGVEAEQTLELVDEMNRKNVGAELAIHARRPEDWAKTFAEIVRFHQASFGQPGAANGPALKNIANESIQQHQQLVIERLQKATEGLRALVPLAVRLTRETDALVRLEALPFEYPAYAREDLRKAFERSQAIAHEAAATAELAQAEGASPRDFERHLGALKAELGRINRLARSVRGWDIGERPRAIAANREAMARLPAEDRQNLEAVAARIPEATEALWMLAGARPELFSRADRLTGVRFSQRLREHVERGFVEENERPGFVEFVRRVATRRFDWRRGGYSHTVNSALTTFLNHPGIILGLIQTARAGQHYNVGYSYGGDGERSLFPMGDFQAGFRPVEVAPNVIRHGEDIGDLPPAELGYERGFLRAIADELSSHPDSLPADRFARTCEPIAVGISKIAQQEVRYGYAHNLKTGDDLVEALASQGPCGLAMADVKISTPDREWFHLHFPVFYDYDKQTRTVAMQAWSHGERRISVDGLRFKNSGRDSVALYYRPSPGLKKFLTPERQPNWQASS